MAENKVVERAREMVAEAAAGTREVVDDGIEAARERFEEAAEDLERRARKTQRELRRQAERVGTAAREKYDAAVEGVKEGYARVRQDVGKLSSDVNDYVRDNPGKSLLIAAGVGFLVGLLVRGGRRREDD